jgi:hypothetical protein
VNKRFINNFGDNICMNYKIVAILFTILFLISGAFAYTGFNRYYYTNNYKPTYYYPRPSYTPTYPTTYKTNYLPIYSGPYRNYSVEYYKYYTDPYYKTYQHYSYPVYNTYNYVTPTYYPSNYRSITIQSGDVGITYSTGVCAYYGYC